MAYIKIALFLACSAMVVLADDSPYDYSPPQARSYDQSSEESYGGDDAKYDFDWKVEEEYNNFGQQEQRDGDNTQGSYFVDLPDGRRQTVTYYVDGDSGFVADVKYTGEARYSEESQEYKPAYQAPQTGYN